MEQELESWKANGRIVLQKGNNSGQMVPVMVNRGRTIQLTEQERLLIQDMVASEEQDPFMNGTLSPVRLIEGARSTQAILENPNALADEDVVKLLEGHHKTFEKKVSEITSPYVLQRMIDLIDSDEVDVSTKRLSAVRERLLTVSGNVPVVEIQTVE